MPHPYLTDDELALLSELYQTDTLNAQLTLPLVMDANIGPLLDRAVGLELKLELGHVKLSFPVALNHPSAHQEQAELASPSIVSNGGHPRAWRLPHPQNIDLKRPNGQPLAAEIRDLSINGMRLLSRRPLFKPSPIKQAHKKVWLVLGQEQQLALQLTLVRQRKGPQFWLATVSFKLNSADKASLSDFVFRGFLTQIQKRQAP